jgi:DNA-binding winged helix-turn-helix (wHTH) protein/tetratricopeptide (TPR) repeat protein
VNTGSDHSYRIDQIEVDVARNCVKRLGTDHVLRYQSFHVLLHLLERSGQPVSKEELAAAIWRDAAVTDNALTQCIAEIRKAFGDDSRNPTYIRTISKVGYQFVAPVTRVARESTESHALSLAAASVSAAAGDSPVQPDLIGQRPQLEVRPLTVPASEVLAPLSAAVPVPPTPAWRQQGAYFALAASCFVLIVAALLARGTPKIAQAAAPVAPLTNGRSLAVMYFENETQRRDFDWLRQGLTDMMITDLSRSGELHVLSRQQLSLLVQDKSGPDGQDLPDQGMHVAQTVHASDFLTGSFCALDKHFRIDIQLHDAHNGQIVFADHTIFQHPGDILSQVDVLAEHLANAMELSLAVTPNIAEVTTKNVEAYQYYSLGVEKAQEFQDAQALNLLKQATELDPAFAMAYARIGYVYALSDFAPETGRPYLEKALHLSGHLSEKDRLSIRAWYAISRGDYGTAAQTLTRISQLYPRETEAYGRLARLLRAEERPQEALAIVNRGLQVNPDDRDLNNTLGFVLLSLHHYREAIDAYQHYVDLAPSEPNAHDSLGMALQQSGNYTAALSQYNQALTLDGEFEPSIIHRGDVYYQTGQYGKAIEQYQRYVRLAQTTDARALGYGDLATVYLAMNRMSEAEEAAANELKNNPNAVWNSLVIALRKSDSTTFKRLEPVLFRNIPSQERGTPGDQRTRFYYQGYIDLEQGNAQQALVAFKAAIHHLPPSSGMDSHEDCLANAELQLGDFKQAASEYDRILQLNPYYPSARARLAEAEAHM